MADYTAGSATVDILPSLKNFHKQIRDGLKKVTDEVKVDVSPDLKNFKAKVDEGLKKDPIKTPVEADTKKAVTKMEAFKKWASKKITVEVDIDRSHIDRAAESFTSLGKSAANAAVAAGLVSGAIHTVALAGKALAPTVGILSAIPGLLLAGGAAAGVVALGMVGLKKSIGDLQPALDALSSKISGVFYDQLQPAIENVNAMLPQLSKGLQGVASSMSAVAVNATDAFRAEGVEYLQKALNGTSIMISRIGEFLTPVAVAMTKFAAASLDAVVQLTGEMKNAGNAVADWITQFANAETIKGWIVGAVEAFKSLAEVVGNVGTIISTVLDAFHQAGVNVTGVFGAATARVAAFLQSVEGQQALQTFATLLRQMSMAVGAAVEALMPALIPALTVAASVIRSLAVAVEWLAPGITTLFQWLAQNQAWVGPLTAGLIGIALAWRVWNAALYASPVVWIIGAIIVAVAALIVAFKWVAANWNTIWNSITNAAMWAWNGFLKPIFTAIANIVSWLWHNILGPIFGIIAGAWILLGDSMLATWNGLIKPIFQFFANVASWLWNNVARPIFDAIGAAWSGVGSAISWTYNNVISPVMNGVGSVIEGAWNFIKPIFDAISNGTGAVGSAFESMGDVIGGIWQGIKDTVHAGIQGVIDIFWNNSLLKLWQSANNSPIGGLIPDPPPPVVVPRFADGGTVSGPGGPRSDVIPALLSNGEFVVNARSAQKFLPLLQAINARKFADGGSVGSAAPAPAKSNPAGALTMSVNPGILSETATAIDQLTASLARLSAQLSTSAIPLTRMWDALIGTVMLHSTQLAQGIVLDSDTINARTILLQQQLAASWLAIQNAITSSHIAIRLQHTLTQGHTEIAWLNISNAVWASTLGQSAAFTQLEAGMSSLRMAMQHTADWAASQWDRMKAAAADPVRWVLEFPFNAGIIAAWNKLDADFALGKHVAPVPIGFATGGRVHGPGTGTSDSINARLSRGEFVVREAVARKHYGFLTALNSGQAEARQAAGGSNASMPGYASGGIVGDTGSMLNAAILRAAEIAKAMNGAPYVWGGAGRHGADCSGYMSIITRSLLGESDPFRRMFTTASFGNGSGFGFTPGLTSAFAIGNTPGSHMAGTLAGVNVESGGSHGNVAYGGPAVGADHSQFGIKASLPVVGGQFVGGGGGGLDIGSIVNEAFTHAYDLIGEVGTRFPGNTMASHSGAIAKQAADKVKGHAVGKLSALTTATGAAGSPEVVAAVRAVAAQYGWGQGAQWDALNALITQESSWNPGAANPTSSARGLFQKMTSIHGPVEPTPGGQAQWGLNYIRNRYGDPASAWAFHRGHNYYDQGGLIRGPQWFKSNTAEPERVLSPAQTRAFDTLVSAISGRGGRTTQDDIAARRSGVTINNYIASPDGADPRSIAADASRRMAFTLRST